MMKQSVILDVKRVLDFIDAPIIEKRKFTDSDGNFRRMNVRPAHILKPKEARETALAAKRALMAELPLSDERRGFYASATTVEEHLQDIRDLLPMLYSEEEIQTYLNKRKDTLDRI